MNNFIYTLLVSCCCVLLNVSLSAQGVLSPKYDDEQQGVVYNKEFTLDIRTHTNGFLALALNFGKIKTYYKTTYYHFEIGEIKHNKEFKSRDFISSTNGGFESSYVYGKQNNLYVLRVGKGVKRYLTEKAIRRGVAIGINYEYGPSIGFVKPYYLDVRSDNTTSGVRSIRFSEEQAQSFLNPYEITGHSGFVRGLGEVSVVPGINGKFGLHFDWGAFDEYVKAVEVGIMADIYFRTIPLMVDDHTYYPNTTIPSRVDITPENIRNRPFFINLYISLQLGKRSQ